MESLNLWNVAKHEAADVFTDDQSQTLFRVIDAIEEAVRKEFSLRGLDDSKQRNCVIGTSDLEDRMAYIIKEMMGMLRIFPDNMNQPGSLLDRANTVLFLYRLQQGFGEEK